MDYVPVEQAQALFARARRAELMSLQLDLEAEYLCSLALTAGGIRHQLLLGPDPHRVPADVEEIFTATVALGRGDGPSPH
jgi:hypothetical protein